MCWYGIHTNLPGLQQTNIAMYVFCIGFQEDLVSDIFTGEYWRMICWCDLLWRWVAKAVIFRFGLSWQSYHIPMFYVCTIYTPCILHSTFGRRIMSLLALCWPNETVWGPRVKILLLLSLKPSFKRFLHTFTHSLCHYVICPFVMLVSLVGIQKKIPLGTTTLPENTHEPHMEATTPNLRRETWRHGFFGKMRGTKNMKAWRRS